MIQFTSFSDEISTLKSKLTEAGVEIPETPEPAISPGVYAN
jgi:hypothetical protein